MDIVAPQLASRIKRVASCTWRLECMTVHLDKAAGTRPAPFPSTAASHPASVCSVDASCCVGRGRWCPARAPSRRQHVVRPPRPRGGGTLLQGAYLSTATATATATYVARSTRPPLHPRTYARKCSVVGQWTRHFPLLMFGSSGARLLLPHLDSAQTPPPPPPTCARHSLSRPSRLFFCSFLRVGAGSVMPLPPCHAFTFHLYPSVLAIALALSLSSNARRSQ
jgi:hypothetical protein